MADNKNIKLDDALLKNATGGDGENTPDPIFHPGDRVRIKKVAEKFDEVYIASIVEYHEFAGWCYELHAHHIENGWQDFKQLEKQLEPF